ncbi:signal transduction histidine kinase [Anaerobacterium chartisolvens]|uniref:histidine kinase n=1 Tax=Anaerobacterium chartisolvens TaxID=1297424 RepID=A0A369AKJ6_9FIRM|nr:HAMP domain-containing sensor histidine kinase [Anaerobacterium chartisolvens]RCX09615.1 signal transduction histidine kinase [Anaerobacterium chartisolvens]
MLLKKRLIISNAAIFIIPVLVTIASALVLVFISSRFLNIDIGHRNMKSMTQQQYNLFKEDSSFIQMNCDMLGEGDFQDYISSRFTALNAGIIALKKNEVIYSTEDFSKIDIEKLLAKGADQLFSSSVTLNGSSYIMRVVPLIFKDGANGNAILLAAVDKGDKLMEYIIIFTAVIFIASFLLTNTMLSFVLSKSISSPLRRLKRAASEISRGNLAYEIIEEGDEEISELCRSFEQMRLKLKDSVHTQIKYDENRKMLISSISHDLKTPITSIKGYIDGILDGVANTPEKVNKYLKTIYSKASQMDIMIDDLLLYSKLDLSQMPFNFEKTDLVKYFTDCVIECRPELEKAGIELSFSNMLPTAAEVLIDREKLRRVVTNIIDNAQKYMDKPNGKISIMLRSTKSSTVIEISDNGPGISKDHLSHIFDRFYRADLSRSRVNGSGLGLAIAKQIIEGHGGRIWAKSRENEGTSIIISLKRQIGEAGDLSL